MAHGSSQTSRRGRQADLAAIAGTIGHVVLDHLLPDRRIRVKARTIKPSNSKYQARGPNINLRSYQATISIDIVRRTLTTQTPA